MHFFHSISCGALHPGWQTEIIQLLYLVVQKSCVFLCVTGGGGFTGGDSLAIESQSRRTINRIGRVRHLLEHFREAMKSVIPQKLARPDSRNHCHGSVREFETLSFILFHPPFLDWTISALQTNSQTLIAVSFETHKTPASIWPYILSNITLPFLSKFKLTGCLIRISTGCGMIRKRRIQFNDVLGFLTRHPSIVDLDLYAIARPTNHRRPRRLLPALQNLGADPWFISWFLNCKQPLRCLTSLKMMSEVYSLLHFEPFNSMYGYNTFNDALYLLPGTAPHVTALHILLWPEADLAGWLHKHISQENSPLAALEGVTTLNLFLSSHIPNLLQSSKRMWWLDMRALITQFLTRFPQLQHLRYVATPPDVERAEQMSFIREIMLACPGMKTVTIGPGSTVDLDMLRN